MERSATVWLFQEINWRICRWNEIVAKRPSEMRNWIIIISTHPKKKNCIKSNYIKDKAHEINKCRLFWYRDATANNIREYSTLAHEKCQNIYMTGWTDHLLGSAQAARIDYTDHWYIKSVSEKNTLKILWKRIIQSGLEVEI